MNPVNFIINKEINTFKLDEYRVLFFDIFYKNNNIYLFLPVYINQIDSDNIKITIDNTILILTQKIEQNEQQYILIHIYNYVSNKNQINLTVEYNNIIKSFTLINIKEDETHNLALTTLFKDDYNIFPMFYDYYKSQGVSHFYMYYNSIITPTIQKVFEKENVTLIEWKFKYYYKDKINNKGTHHAQTSQMHHAIYRYGKDNINYMIFCDLDEYLYIPKFTINEYILNNIYLDIIGFCNYWSNTIDNKYPENFPNKFLIGEKFKYGYKSKNIYKISSINLIGIHYIYSNINNLKSVKDFMMFHFYNFTKKDRLIENVNNIFEII